MPRESTNSNAGEGSKRSERNKLHKEKKEKKEKDDKDDKKKGPPKKLQKKVKRSVAREALRPLDQPGGFELPLAHEFGLRIGILDMIVASGIFGTHVARRMHYAP
ncbi:hypothetical protein NUW58_g3535 [Xylaria curta]|uniref:Uncharacterized protein n=1 Tax=Xylaria curta TaxID=42375 RepID=A0ACC1PAH0_9PEZI|nr:hypothetical protein NUW58_g3535 [Xylaria curta]